MKLSLPRRESAEAQLRQRIGAGLCFYYTLAGETGRLALSLPVGQAPEVCPLSLRCNSGLLQLSDAEGALALMSECPALPYAEAEMTPWYWPLFNQSLSVELQQLFGDLSPENQTNNTPFTLRLELTLGELHSESMLMASIATLNALLDKAGWQPQAAALPSDLPLRFPLTLGALTLSVAQLRQLQPEDVLLPTRDAFSPYGEGTLRLAGIRLTGALTGEADRAFFTLSDLEITPVTFPYDDDDMAPAAQPNEAWQGEPAPGLDGLPLALTVRCGQLRLTLGELQHLSAGSTVMVDNVQPGEALLCHGDFPLAKGELVDVEGRLGLQITHMLPGSINPLGHGG